MDDRARDTLTQLIADHGTSLCEDPRRCEALLRDLCAEHPREINVLIGALEQGVPAELLGTQSGMPHEVLLARLATRLRDNLGLAEDVAQWAAETWAIALGVLSEDELGKSTGTRGAPSDISSPPPSSPVAPHAPLWPFGGRPLFWVVGIAGALIAIVVVVALATAGGGGDDDQAVVLPDTDTATRETPANPVLVPSPTRAPDDSLQPGDELLVQISEGQTLEWTFPGEAGQLVEIRADRDPSGNAYPRLTLFDPGGSIVASDLGSPNRDYAVIDHTLESTGRFRVTLEGGDGAGLVSLRFLIEPFVDLEIGTEMIGALDFPEERDRYRFTGSPGQLVEIRMDRDPSGSVGPRLGLFNPFGERILYASDSWGRGYALDWTVLEDEGEFVLVAEAMEANAVGSYTIEVRIDPFIPFSIGNSVNGLLARSGQGDRYQFNGAAGEKICVQVDAGNVRPRVELYDPFGEREGMNTTQIISRGIDLDSTGAYYFRIAAFEPTETGGYTFAANYC